MVKIVNRALTGDDSGGAFKAISITLVVIGIIVNLILVLVNLSAKPAETHGEALDRRLDGMETTVKELSAKVGQNTTDIAVGNDRYDRILIELQEIKTSNREISKKIDMYMDGARDGAAHK